MIKETIPELEKLSTADKFALAVKLWDELSSNPDEIPVTEEQDRWVLERKLGEGGFGEVWLGRDKRLKTERVFKFCFRADRVRSLKREVTLFRLLKARVGEHPNIVG